jgi:hypothetical protein
LREYFALNKFKFLLISREFCEAVIKEHPDDVVEFSWRYFKAKVEEKEKAELAEFNARMNGTHHG